MAKEESFWSRLLSFEDVDRTVFSIALPNIVSNISTPLVGLVGSYVAGHLGSSSKMAGVALGTASFNVVYLVFIFLQKGTTGLTAQAKGAYDFAEVRACAGRFVSLGLLLGFTLLALREQIGTMMFTILLQPPDEESAVAAYSYFNARLLGAPAAFGNFAVQGWLNGMQQPKRVMLQQLVLNIMNSACCFFFSLPLGGRGLGLGPFGVGLADAVAQTTAFAIGISQVVGVLTGFPFGAPLPGKWDSSTLVSAQRLKEGMVLSANILLRSICISTVSTSFNSVGSTFGKATLSANVMIAQLQTLMSYGTDGFSNACEALVGEAIGAKSPGDLRKAVFSSFKWGFILALVFSATYTCFGHVFFMHMTDIANVQAAAMKYLPWLTVAPLLTVWSYLFDGVYVGATLSFEMVTSMCISAFIYCIVLYFSVYLFDFQNNGLMASFYTFQVMRGVTLGSQYYKVKQKAEPEIVAKISDNVSKVQEFSASLPNLNEQDPVDEQQPVRAATQPLLNEKKSLNVYDFRRLATDSAYEIDKSRNTNAMQRLGNNVRKLLTVHIDGVEPELVRTISKQLPASLNAF